MFPSPSSSPRPTSGMMDSQSRGIRKVQCAVALHPVSGTAERCSFYFSGVAGSTSRLIDRDGQEMLVPLRIEPRGIVEPFAWMINQLR